MTHSLSGIRCGCPARAGMNPTTMGQRNGFHHEGCPARAGMNLQTIPQDMMTLGLPRARGDEPHGDHEGTRVSGAAPRARG